MIKGAWLGVQNNTYQRWQKIFNLVKSNTPVIGEYRHFINNADFGNWLICDGRSLLITDYPLLFDVIGTNFGSVDSNHFNLPNLSGRVMASLGTTGNSGDGTHSLGDVAGSENITISTSQLPSHYHTGNTNASVTGITSSGTTNSQVTGLTINSVGNHEHTYQDAYFAENFGGGANNVFGTNAGTDSDNSFYWRTSSGGYSTSAVDLNSGSAGNHTHSTTELPHSHSFTANVVDLGHFHSFTTNSVGNGDSVPNTQPTLYGGNMFIFAKFD